jgi:hypothetical protein
MRRAETFARVQRVAENARRLEIEVNATRDMSYLNNGRTSPSC